MTFDPSHGLTGAEAQARLTSCGANELPQPASRSWPRIVLETMREPMFLLLMGAAVLYLVLGDLGEGLFLVAGAGASIGLVVIQEVRSERALAALRELSQPKARVIREGSMRIVPAREVVPGDTLLVGEGERIPADALLAGGEVMSVDESALTGESAPVTKSPAAANPQLEAAPVPGADRTPWLFAGTLAVRGQGVAIVARTGSRSALGAIGASLAAIVDEPTPLQKNAGRLVTLLGLLALAFCGLVTVAYGLIEGAWIAGVLSGITVAIALIPEEFPMVLAVFLALGAWRMARSNVLTRRSATIESLGRATVLCVDKTGTLTENRMRVARLWAADGGDIAIEGTSAGKAGWRQLLEVAALASAVRPVDPMDRAIREQAALPPEAREPERIWPLRPSLLAVVQAWRRPGEERILAAKGAPEAIFTLCRLGQDEIVRLHGVVQRYADGGLRVLGAASARIDGPPDMNPEDVPFAFAGLVGFRDPLRSGVPAALAEAHAAGITVVMITGDHPATAKAIGAAAGLDTEAGILLGAEVVALPPAELEDRLRHVRVCARISPEQKLRIVEALKANGEIVAMTGDGVNDAPALEAAHVGIAMGRRGTDVAREAADLVLLDDSFSSIVAGVRLGRRIFENLRRALTYITAIHVPIAGLAIAPVVFGLPPLLLPMHVVLMELAIDPTCALVFEAEPSDADAMKRRPPRPGEPLFGLSQVAAALIQGVGVFAGVLGLYLWALANLPQAEARGAAFVALVLGNLVLAFADSASGGPPFAAHRRAYWTIAAAIGVLLACILGIPDIAGLFGVAMPGPLAFLFAGATALTCGGWPWLARRAAEAPGRRQAAAEARAVSG